MQVRSSLATNTDINAIMKALVRDFKNNEIKIIEFFDKVLNKKVNISLEITDVDFWNYQQGYAIHYCLDYNSISIYRENDKTYKTIYSEKINK